MHKEEVNTGLTWRSNKTLFSGAASVSIPQYPQEERSFNLIKRYMDSAYQIPVSSGQALSLF
jgi:hypothetical protein